MLLGIARGVGCGIVKNGMLYMDSRKLAPEIGHVSVDYRGKKCVCGSRGCLELYVNTDEVLTRFKKATGLSRDFAEFCAMREDERLAEIFEEVTEKLSSALISTINLLNCVFEGDASARIAASGKTGEDSFRVRLQRLAGLRLWYLAKTKHPACRSFIKNIFYNRKVLQMANF